MFRVINLRKNTLLELEASVSLTVHVWEGNDNKRRYYRLNLEINKIEFFPASWTIVHPIDEKSPLNTLDINNLVKEDLEIVIQLKAFDDTFSQHVHSRYSDQSNEIIVGAKFKPATQVDDTGGLIIRLDEFHDYEVVEYQ